MDGRDRQAIEELFGKIAQVEGRSGPRDAKAEAYMGALIARQPAAPYYMAQTIVAQEQALNAAQRRIEALERAPQQGGGGFLGGLFGGGERQTPRQPQARDPAHGRDAPVGAGPWSGAGRGIGSGFGGGGLGGGGGGFLAGAAQTAMGVAGGVVLGNMLADWMSPDAATATAGGGDAAGSGADADAAADTDGGWFGGSDGADVQNADADMGDAGFGDSGGFDFDA